MICYARTDIGRQRKMNQDSLFASVRPVGPLPNLFMVADGMGGHKAGDYASRFVVETIEKNLKDMDDKEPVAALMQSIERTNLALFSEARKDPEKEGMGSTLVAVTMVGNVMYVANVGDSRLYLIGHEINQKNIITRAMGIGPQVRTDFFEVPLKAGDCALLCSDGLTNMVEDEAISQILRSSDSLSEKTDALIQAANENGGKDNIAVILVEPQISEVSL